MIPTPFTNIAISLSGGGYRATAYHLGALSYLNYREHKKSSLLKKVKILSTISGGTLTGVMYALYLAEGRSFEDCFDKLYHLLEEDKLVDRALHNLNNPKSWKNKNKTRDVINAFAEVYNEYFYEGATFEKLYEDQKSHLRDVTFGSSEFTFGIQFRFQEEHDKGKFGNFYLNLPDNVSKEIRLADAAAASSCFPGGFEPMIMPHDFGNGPDSPVSETWFSKKYKGENYPRTALMDGGVIDNQGIEGVKLAEDRHVKQNKKPFIGTYIVSDVSAKMMIPYKVPEFKYGDFKNLFTINSISIVVGLLLTAIIVLLASGQLPFWGIIMASSILPFTIIWFILLFILNRIFRNILNESIGQEQLPELLKDFRVIFKTPLYILFYLIKFRVTSVLKMVSDVFMKRIRSLQLDSLYSSPDWFYRFKSNYIYSLEEDDTKKEKGIEEEAEDDNEKKAPLPPLMKKIIKAANCMPTTLWFSDKNKQARVLDDLIACGQFTMCFNLIKYAKRIQKGKHEEVVWNQLTKADQEDILALQALMEEDWAKFLVDPYWLLKQLKEKKSQA